ncbi:MAG: hypothetical protein V1495_02350 [Pseudomonadota bacterium]
MIRRFTILFVILLPAANALSAGFIDSLNGTPYVWKPVAGTPIPVAIDPSALSTSITNPQGRALVQQAFSTWRSAAAANAPEFANATAAPALSKDVTGANYKEFVTYDSTTGRFSVQAGYTVIILFDQDGSIFQDLFPSDWQNTLGISSAGGYDDATTSITKGFAILNGAAGGVSQTTLLPTITHEFGHLHNLAHTQLNWEVFFDSDTANDQFIPTMFPYLPSNNPTVLNNLKREDEFSLAYLYPLGGGIPNTGNISGKIVRRDGAGVRAVNVYCRNQANPIQDAVSWVSDQILAGKGEYLCGNLPAGSYTVEIEPIFVAINIFEPDPPFVATEYYNGTSEDYDPAIDDKTASSEVTVTTGEDTTGIDIVLNEDGRLQSGKAVTGGWDAFTPIYPALEYFITVPKEAVSVVFEVKSSDSNAPVALYGKCDPEFSLTEGVTSFPIYDPAGGTQQAEFAANSANGYRQAITLDSRSTPAITPCTYHLFIENPSQKDTTFSLTATVNGVAPKLTISRGAGSVVEGGSGDLLVMSKKLTATGDTLTVRSMVLTDIGMGNLSSVKNVALYEDTNGDGQVNAGGVDRLISAAPIVNGTARTFTFKNLREVIDPANPETILLVYTTNSSAGGSWIWVFLLGGLFVTALRVPFRRWGILVLVTAIVGSGLSCRKTTRPTGYAPEVANGSNVTLTGQTFGNAIHVSVVGAEPTSVKSFFE